MMIFDSHGVQKQKKLKKRKSRRFVCGVQRADQEKLKIIYYVYVYKKKKWSSNYFQ